jgi:cell division protein FtsZ
MGMAIMGTGVASGEHRARTAATAAISSPLLEDVSVHGARGVIINVTGGPDLTLAEVSEASEIVNGAAHEDANIIFGAAVDPAMEGRIKITVIATGFDRKSAGRVVPAATLQTPVDLHNYTAHLAKPAEPAPMDQPMMEMAAPAAAGVVPPIAVTRRPPLDLSLPLRSSGDEGKGNGLVFDGDLSSPLDVPAFLRRQN